MYIKIQKDENYSTETQKLLSMDENNFLLEK